MWKDLVSRKARQLDAQRTTLPMPDFSRIKSPRGKKKEKKNWEKELHMALLLRRVEEVFEA